MLPKLMDAGQFRHAVGIDADAFTQAALAGALPRALGLHNGAAVWFETEVQKFASESGLVFNGGWLQDARAVSSVAENEAAAVAQPGAQSSASDVTQSADEYPEMMAAGAACDYLGCGANWLSKITKDGVISSVKTGGFSLYRRADLDALKSLPVYRFRKRHGYSHGKLKKPTVAAPAPTPMATAETFLGESAAADFLGMDREVLALARKDGTGPAVVHANGQPKYRVADLEAFKKANSKPVGRVIRSTDRVMDTAAAAEYLGITAKQLQNLHTHGHGPVHEMKADTGGRGRRLYSAADLEAWKRGHAETLGRLVTGTRAPMPTRSTGSKVKATKSTNGKSKGKKATLGGGKARPRNGQKYPTPSGARVRH